MTCAADTTRTARLYTAPVTGAQVFSFADLVRRVSSADCAADDGRGLHQDYVDALFAFLLLTPDPGDSDGDAYVRARAAGKVPNWGMDREATFEPDAEWLAQCAGCHDVPARWPGLAPAGTAAYEMTLTAAQILDFSGLVRRLGIQGFPQDGGLRLRHSLWDALQAFAELLPDPSDEDSRPYFRAVLAGELTDWGADPRPLTETAAERAGRARLAAEEGKAGR